MNGEIFVLTGAVEDHVAGADAEHGRELWAADAVRAEIAEHLVRRTGQDRPIDGDRLQHLAHQVLPDTDFVPAPLPDDICFYRELPQVQLADLPQLGEYAREAYQQALAAGNSPHARADVPWQLPGT